MRALRISTGVASLLLPAQVIAATCTTNGIPYPGNDLNWRQSRPRETTGSPTVFRRRAGTLSTCRSPPGPTPRSTSASSGGATPQATLGRMIQVQARTSRCPQTPSTRGSGGCAGRRKLLRADHVPLCGRHLLQCQREPEIYDERRGRDREQQQVVGDILRQRSRRSPVNSARPAVHLSARVWTCLGAIS